MRSLPQKRLFFSENQCVAADGGFEGDGPVIYSFDNPNTEERVLYNLAFKEVRMSVENAFGRVQMWFPILGVQRKYWNYDEEMLCLAVEACCKLHNWIIRSRGLRYDPISDPRNHWNEIY